jgi:hypothetical protein
MPESVLYPVIPATSSSSSPTKSSSGLMKSLSQWENKLGWVGRGWLEGLTEEEKASGEEEGELFKEGETWALKWGYGNAVDGDAETAFRSRDGALFYSFDISHFLSSSTPQLAEAD